MFDPKSRYADSRLETRTIELSDGRVVAYKKPRVLPQFDPEGVSGNAASRHGERLDQFSTRILGDPLLAWRLCDANDVMDPLTLDVSWPKVWRVPKGRG